MDWLGPGHSSGSAWPRTALNWADPALVKVMSTAHWSMGEANSALAPAITEPLISAGPNT